MCHINFTMACVFSWNICSDSKRDAVYRHLSCLSNFVVCFLSFMMHFVLCLLFFAVIPFVTQQIAYCCSLVSALRLFSFHLFTLNVCCWYPVRSHVHNTMNMLIKKIIITTADARRAHAIYKIMMLQNQPFSVFFLVRFCRNASKIVTFLRSTFFILLKVHCVFVFNSTFGS